MPSGIGSRCLLNCLEILSLQLVHNVLMQIAVPCLAERMRNLGLQASFPTLSLRRHGMLGTLLHPIPLFFPVAYQWISQVVCSWELAV